MEETFKTPGEYEHDGILFNAGYKSEVLQQIKNEFKFKDDDTIVITYPKSGTTWMQAILQYMSVDGKEDLSEDLLTKIPYLEASFPAMKNDMIDIVKTMKSPRMIKSHLPYSFLERALSGTKAKVIIVMRNPKDTLVSYYHFYQINKIYGCVQGSFDEFFNLFMKGNVIYGDWFDFVKGYWKQKNQPNVLIVKYEDMKTNPRKIVNDVAAFIGKEITKEKAQYIVKMTSFDIMKPSIEACVKKLDILKKDASFMRKGIVGDWKSHFTAKQNSVFDKIYINKMKGRGLDFVFEEI